MNQAMSVYLAVQNYINGSNFLGIPLDIMAHFFVSMALTSSLLHFKVKATWVILIVFFIAILKEIIDWKLQNYPTMLETIKDIVVTMIYPALIYFIRKKLKTI